MGCTGSTVVDKDSQFITTQELTQMIFDGTTKEEFKAKEKPLAKLFDTSFGGKPAKDKFLEVSIPTATFLDVGSDLADKSAKFPNTFPTAEIMKTTMESFGLNLDDTIVVYGQQGKMAGAARALFVLNAFGFKNVRILDGGLKKWTDEKLPTEPGKELPFTVVCVKSKGSSLNFSKNIIANYDEMKSFAEGELPDVQVVDLRPEKAFNGNADDNIPGCRQGNIPGSINLPVTDLINAESQTFKGDEEVFNIVNKLKLDPNKRTIVMCRTGVAGSFGYLALKRQHFKNLQLYDGSWSEFGSL